MRRRSIAGACIIAMLATAGCGGAAFVPLELAGTPQPRMSAPEMIALINAGADSIRALRADLDLSFRRGPGEKVRRCDGKILALRGEGRGAARIYLKGYRRLAPTIFTLVSDGSEFWLHVPSRNTVYNGPVVRGGWRDGAGRGGSAAAAEEGARETPGTDLDPAGLSRALFVEPIDSALDCRISFAEGSYTVETVEDGVIRRRLRVAGRRLCIVEETYYTREGEEELEISRSGFARADGAAYPGRISIVQPASGTEIEIDVGALDLAPRVPPAGTFRFVPPGGARIERIE